MCMYTYLTASGVAGTEVAARLGGGVGAAIGAARGA